MRRRLLIALLMSSVAFPALADKRVALVFGQDKYETIRPLENAGNDAEAVEEALDKLGFEVSLETNRDLKRMRRALEDFQEDAAGADVALVYFAGHGVEVSGQNMLLPTDADATSVDALKQSSLPLEEVQATLAKISKVNLVLLDACRNDPFGGAGGETGRGAVALNPTGDVQQIKPGLGRLGSAENLLYTFSAAPGATAADGSGENSPFTEALVKYLDTDGLEIRSVMTLVQQEVYDLSRGGQLPYVENGLPEVFFAATEKSDLPERERLLLAMADVNAELRDEVERLAKEKDMPLAPLYGALISSDAQALSIEDRRNKLTEAANAFVATREQIRTMASSDPQVAALREEAEKQLGLGAFDTARGKLDEAAKIDSTSRDALKANFVERTISEASTHIIAGGASRTNLKYDLAIDSFGKATALMSEVEKDLPATGRAQQIDAYIALGELYQTIGDLPKSAASIEAGHAVAARMVEADPTGAAGLNKLADIAMRSGEVKEFQGSIPEAQAFYEASIDAGVRATQANPDDTDRQVQTARAIIKRGWVRKTQGEVSESLADFDEAETMMRSLVEKRPDIPLARRTLIVALLYKADVDSSLGRNEEALAGYEKGLDLVRPLAEEYPNEKRYQVDLASTHLSVAFTYFNRLKSFDKALEHYEAAYAIGKRLAEADPANITYRSNLATFMEGLADVTYTKKGGVKNSIPIYEEAVAIRRELIAKDPTNKSWQSALAGALTILARHYIGDFQDDKAMETYQESMKIQAVLADSDPANVSWQRSLMFTMNEIARLQGYGFDYAASVKTYQESARRLEALIALKPEELVLARDAAFVYNKIGEAYEKLGDKEALLKSKEQALNVAKRMAAANPNDLGVQRGLSAWYGTVASAYSLEKRYEEAFGYLEEGRKLDEKLVADHPDDAQALADLAHRNRVLGFNYQNRGDRQSELRAFEEAVRVGEKSLAISDDPYTKATLAYNQWSLGNIHAALGSETEAMAAYENGLFLVRQAIAAKPDEKDNWNYIVVSNENGIRELGGNPPAQ